MRQERLEPWGLAVAVAVVDLPLLAGRVLSGHDTGTWLTYGIELAANLREGLLLPAWAAGFNAGFGGPGLLFYPPLLHFAHAPFILAGIPPIFAVTLVAVVVHFLSGLALRAFLRGQGLAGGAFAGALVYVLSPYRVVTLYERTALAEHAAFVFPPLLLLAASAARERRALGIAATAAAGAALVLTNVPSALILGGGAAVVLLVAGERGLGRKGLLCAGALAAGLGAFALVPQALAGRWLATELWYGPSAGGFRPSANVLFSARALDPAFNERVSWAVVATAAAAGLAFLLCPRGPRVERRTLAWGGVAAVAVLSALPAAGPLWEAAPVLDRLQFPWRTGGLLTLSAAVLTGALGSRARAALVVAFTATTAVPGVGRSVVPVRALAPERLQPAWESPAFSPGRAATGMAGLGDAGFYRGRNDLWFLPRTARALLLAELTAESPRGLDPLRGRPAALLRSDAAAVEPVSWSQTSGAVRVVAPDGGRLVFHVLAFPGMTVRVDGRPALPVAEPLTGLLAVDLPPGARDASWSWQPPPPVVSGRMASLLALVVWGGLLAGGRIRLRSGAPP